MSHESHYCWNGGVSKEELPRKVVITYKNEALVPQYGSKVSSWNAAVRLSDSDFRFTPPKGAEKVDVLTMESNRGGRES